jgi:lipopolysaccharide export LptBFGC system permease protein LptF
MTAVSETHVRAVAAFWQTFFPPFCALGISVVLFVKSPKEQSLAARGLVSLSGAITLLLYLIAMWVFWSGRSARNYGSAFLVACLVPLVLIAVSILSFRGRRALLFIHFPNLLCLLWVWFVGSMAVTDDWL